MSVTMDREVERLMLDALDDPAALNERDHAAVWAYLAQHPEERALFDQMQRMDHALQAEPPAPVPGGLTARIMSALGQAQHASALTHVASPHIHTALKGRSGSHSPLQGAHLFLLIGLGSLLICFVGATALVIYLLVFSTLVQAGFPWLLTISEVGLSLINVFSALVRAAYSNPIAWIVSLGSLAIVALWLRIVMGVFVPRPASA
jgi:hypothetical protein